MSWEITFIIMCDHFYFIWYDRDDDDVDDDDEEEEEDD